jgi:hypothetical protein
VDAAPLLERLAAERVIGRVDRKTRPLATSHRRVPSTASVSDLVSEQRR